MKTAEQIQQLEEILENEIPSNDYEKKSNVRLTIKKIKLAEKFGGYDVTVGYAQNKQINLSENLISLDILEYVTEKSENTLTVGTKIHKDITHQLLNTSEALRVYENIHTSITIIAFNTSTQQIVGFVMEDVEGC